MPGCFILFIRVPEQRRAVPVRGRRARAVGRGIRRERRVGQRVAVRAGRAGGQRQDGGGVRRRLRKRPRRFGRPGRLLPRLLEVMMRANWERTKRMKRMNRES